MVPCKLQNFKLPNFPIKCRGFRSTQREYGHYHSAYQTVRCPIIGLQSLNSNGNCSSHSVECQWSPCNVPLANRRTVNRIDLSKTRLVVNVDRVQKGIWPCQKKKKLKPIKTIPKIDRTSQTATYSTWSMNMIEGRLRATFENMFKKKRSRSSGKSSEMINFLIIQFRLKKFE